MMGEMLLLTTLAKDNGGGGTVYCFEEDGSFGVDNVARHSLKHSNAKDKNVDARMVLRRIS